jgi:hypothetical protein
VTDDVGLAVAEVLQNRTRVVGLLLDAERPIVLSAVYVSAAAVSDQFEVSKRG